MASNRTWMRELNGELVWITDVDGRLTMSKTLAANTGADRADYHEFTRLERIAWRLIRRPPKSRPRTQEPHRLAPPSRTSD